MPDTAQLRTGLETPFRIQVADTFFVDLQRLLKRAKLVKDSDLEARLLDLETGVGYSSSEFLGIAEALSLMVQVPSQDEKRQS
jgi:hypothetical protein